VQAATTRIAQYDKNIVRTIRVATATANYKVHVGTDLLTSLARRLAPWARGRVFVLTSPPIWAIWHKQFLASFAPNAQPTVLLLPPGEKAKRLASVERLLEELASAGADRSSLLIAFGGGIVGDVGGFVAAIYMRGIAYAQVPTTVLAQVDSSVGGKTGVNLAAGKNLAGAFHHPVAVFADIDCLRTLPANELRAGLMESVKAGIIRDPDLFRLIEKNLSVLLKTGRELDAALLAQVVARSVAMKAEVVGLDEREGGLRMILNLGHTIGHAIEAVTRYRVLLHGEAVGWGMLVALQIAHARKLLTDAQLHRTQTMIHGLGPLPPFRATADALLLAAGRDKKNSRGTRRFVLPRGIGDAIVAEDVTDTELHAATQTMLSDAAPRRGPRG
jgi:3-dehydroquinate synthase